MQPLLSLVAALAPALQSETVTLTPRLDAGATLTRTVTQTAAFTGGSLTVEMDGRPVPAEFLPDLSIESTERRAVTLADRHTARGVIRSFEALEATASVAVDMGGYMGQGETAFDATADSPLEARRVRFGAEGAAFVDEDGGALDATASDKALLQGLAPGADLAAWWPGRAVAVGEAWQGPADALLELSAPSGDLGWRWTSAEVERRTDRRSLAGEVTLTLRALREVDGRPVAEVDVAGRLERTESAATDLRDVPVADGTATETRTATLALRGTLTLDVRGGHLTTAELSAEVEEVVATVKDPGQPGPEYRSTLTFRGTEAYTVTVAR